jgi:hypothetical protein
VLNGCRNIPIRDVPPALGLRHGILDLVPNHRSTVPSTATTPSSQGGEMTHLARAPETR